MIWKLSCPVLGGAGGGDISSPLGNSHPVFFQQSMSQVPPLPDNFCHPLLKSTLAYNYFRKPADALAIPGAEGKNLLLFGGADRMLPESSAVGHTPELEEQLRTLFPGSKMLHSWTGLIEESKDGMPIIARHPDLPQVFGIRAVGGSGLDSSQFVANELSKILKGGDSVLSATRFAN